VLIVGYTSDIVDFTWLNNSVEVDEHMQLPQFELEDIIQRDCSQNYTAGKCLADISKTRLLNTAVVSTCVTVQHWKYFV